jgi:hypothetical protein
MLGKGLNFYASFKNKEPQKAACDFSSTSKESKIEIFPKDVNATDFAPNEFLYMNFESD